MKISRLTAAGVCSLTSSQEQLLLGTLLGDGCLTKPPRNMRPRYLVRHGPQQKDYVLHKYEILKNLVRTPPHEVVNRGFGKTSWVFNTLTTELLTPYWEMCYPNGKKTVTQAWLDRVGPMGLAYLWMDDGSVCEGHGRLHSEGFSLAENQLLASWFTKQGFHAAPHHAKNKYWYLAFTREGLRNLVGVIEPFVINLLKYKLEVLPALPTIPCACCGTLLQAHNNQASGVNAVCGNTDCLRWQNRMRNRTYLADPENLAFHNAQGRIRYHRDLEKSREANRAVAKRMRADPERRANYNRRRQQWRAMRRANGLSAP